MLLTAKTRKDKQNAMQRYTSDTKVDTGHTEDLQWGNLVAKDKDRPGDQEDIL